MNDIQQRIKQSSHVMLDIVDDMLRKLAPPPAASRPPLIVARRQLANTLGVWHFCAEITCQRARCCRGEPSHCLRSALPLLSPDLFATLISARKRKRRP